MAHPFELEVITPERSILREPVEFVTIPSLEGYYGILAGHAPMIGGLRHGVLHYRQAGGEKKPLAISGGFFEVTPEKTTVLAEEATLPEDVDVAAVRQEVEEARRTIEAGGDSAEVALARQKLERAVAQLRAAGHND